MMLHGKPLSKGKPQAKPGEEGYMLLAVIFLTVMLLLALSIAAPKVAADLKRDREIELMHRGKQYERAIQLYYRKYGSYPPNMDSLEKSNNIRFLRKRYKDPFTGKADWKIIHFGEAKTPTPGFFGQPLAGAGAATGATTASPLGAGGSPATGGPLFGGSNITQGSTDSGATTSTDSSGASTAGATPGATPGSTPGATPGAPGAAGPTNGQTLGGAGVIGVESASPKLAILEYRKKKHFNEWEFVYDPLADQSMNSGNGGAIGQPIGNGTGTTPGFGSSPISGPTSGPISSPGIGTGTMPTAPPPPQQQ